MQQMRFPIYLEEDPYYMTPSVVQPLAERQTDVVAALSPWVVRQDHGVGNGPGSLERHQSNLVGVVGPPHAVQSET
eukprot:364426-Chlamydomonas_euryale.AAC.2